MKLHVITTAIAGLLLAACVSIPQSGEMQAKAQAAAQRVHAANCSIPYSARAEAWYAAQEALKASVKETRMIPTVPYQDPCI